MGWGDVVDFFDPVLEAAGAVGDFINENESLINIGVSVGTAAFTYYQQEEAIRASELASNRALAMQSAQNEAEMQSMRLRAPNESAQLDLLSRQSDIAGSINDFLYGGSVGTDMKSVGLNVPTYEKQLGLV